MTGRAGVGVLRWWVGLAASVVVVAALLAVDATWLRPLARHYVREHAGRQIDFDQLSIRLNASLQPVVRLRNLRLENAPWAAPRPLIRADEFDVTVAWESLLGRGMVVPLLVVAGADIDLEQQADGLRNWRIANPQDRGPGKVRIRSLQAERSRMRIAQAGQNLEIELATTPLATPRRLAGRAELPLTQTLRFGGRRGEHAFAGEVDIGQVLTLVDTGADFALSGRIRSGPSQIAIEGVAHDLLQFAGFDATMRLESSRLDSLGALFGARSLPALTAAASGQVQKDGARWTVSALQAHAGRSDISGAIEFDRRQDGSAGATLQASLTSARLDLAEMRPAADIRRAAEPGTPSPVGLWKPDRLDGEIDLKVAKVEGAPGRIGPLADLHAHAVWRAGHLNLAPLTFAVAGGTAAGKLTLDASRSPPDAAVDLQLSGLRLEDLAATRSLADRPSGALNLALGLQSHGDSFTALRDAASGHVSANLLNATLPAQVDAELSLDGGKWLQAMFQPGKRVAVTCSVADMNFDAGRGRTRRLFIETENVVLSGTAAVDLKRESFELVLTPHRKQSTLLALNKSVRMSGTFKQPKVGLVASGDTPVIAGCTQAASR